MFFFEREREGEGFEYDTKALFLVEGKGRDRDVYRDIRACTILSFVFTQFFSFGRKERKKGMCTLAFLISFRFSNLGRHDNVRTSEPAVMEWNGSVHSYCR